MRATDSGIQELIVPSNEASAAESDVEGFVPVEQSILAEAISSRISYRPKKN